MNEMNISVCAESPKETFNRASHLTRFGHSRQASLCLSTRLGMAIFMLTVKNNTSLCSEDQDL